MAANRSGTRHEDTQARASPVRFDSAIEVLHFTLLAALQRVSQQIQRQAGWPVKTQHRQWHISGACTGHKKDL